MAPSKPEHIYKKGNICITVSNIHSIEALGLLKKTIYGTSGPKYKHTGQENKIKDITRPYFFDLKENQTVVGTYCLSGRNVVTGYGTINSFYGRYLAIHPDSAGKGYGSLLKSEAVKYIESTGMQPHLLYSYVEESNTRSMRISNKENFASIGVLEAIVFSRLYPKMDSNFVQLQDKEKEPLLSLLKEAYKDHILVHFDQVFYKQNYFVLKEKGEIIAGLQANPVLWRIVDMPGISGKFILNILPFIPVMNRLINPDNYHFVALEAMYIKPGYDKELIKLLESVLYHFNVTSALLLLDLNSPIYIKLKASGQLGIMDSMKQHIHTHVMVKANGMSLDQVKQFVKQPIYTSAFDYT
jgi:L-amino acid N-acyltransferase YncA